MAPRHSRDGAWLTSSRHSVSDASDDAPAVECSVAPGPLRGTGRGRRALVQIARGEVLAILGPNGAGKTSTVETLEGYRKSERGQVRVLGLDPRQRPSGAREADRGDAPARRDLPDHHRPPGRVAFRALLRRSGGPR